MQNQISNNWQTEKLENVVGIIDGDRGTNYPNKQELMKEGYCLFLNTKNVSGTDFSFLDNQFINEAKDKKLRKGKLQREDFVLTTRGTVGNIAYYSDKIPYENMRINSGMVILRNNKNKVDNGFLKQYLTSKIFRLQIDSLVSGSAQPQLPIRDLSQFMITIPNLTTQKKIAFILSAFDEKIEINNRIAKTLEEMAQALFKEWFINFRFPGYEKVEFVDSELGKIPRRCVIKRIGDFLKVKSGLAYKADDISVNNSYKPIITMGSIHIDRRFTGEELKFYKGEYDEGDLIRGGEIIVASHDVTQNKKFLGSPAIIPPLIKEAILGNNLFALENNSKVPGIFFYQLLKTRDFRSYILGQGKGSNILFLSKSSISDYKFVFPDDNTLNLFLSLLHPLSNKLYTLYLESQKLAALRDLLLPKLVIGEVEVK